LVKYNAPEIWIPKDHLMPVLSNYTARKLSQEELRKLGDAETQEWWLKEVPEVWAETRGKGVTVVVLDTGAPEHPDIEYTLAEKFIDGHMFDRDYHSTHVGGIIGARDNAFGIVGIAHECNLGFGKVLNDNGWGNPSILADGINWVVDNYLADIANFKAGKLDTKPRYVINMSLGGKYFTCPDLEKAIARAYENNVILVAATGNSGDENQVLWPAAYKEVIAVGALDKNDERAYFSQTGEDLFVMWPGHKVYSTYKDSGYVELSGTSMASHGIAGVVALILSKHSLLGGETPVDTQDQLKEHLIRGAYDLGPKGFERFYGNGRPNIKYAIQ